MGALSVIETGGEPPTLALELPERTTFEQWVAIGRRLCLTEKALNWHIGDWWAFGDHRYGERAKAAAEGIFGREFQTLADMAWVCRQYEPSRRHEVLSFTHHREVASLPPDQADELLRRAEAEEWSKSQLRREVQALRVGNDNGSDDEEHESKPLPTQTERAELARAYEMVVELGEALERMRPLSKREGRVLALARDYVQEARSGQRPCPDDFDVIFVEKGRLECETWYRASRLTVNRWLVERGKRRLIELRAAFLKHQRDQAHADEKHEPPPAPADDPLLSLATLAANFLRISRYGGWRITRAPEGGWRVGTVHKSSEELIAMAERQGFDRIAALQCDGGEAVQRAS